jgi:acetyltransferase-like isoleucine patch superfamily enzyme
MNIGKNVSLGPPMLLVDPDLTEIGDHAVLGAAVAIAAHFGKATPDGKLIYITAPVKIGARATVGAFTIVSLGCIVGEDAIIEPQSYLPPYTQVPANEVWGGRPAVFLRHNSKSAESAADAETA